jgi:hypothetical protein
MKSLRPLVSLNFLFVMGFLTGCGDAKYQPVTGEIVFPDDTPVTGLDGGRISFQQVNNPSAETPAGAIDANGKFTLGTATPTDGAPEGDYQAVITPPQPTGDEQLPKVIDDKHKNVGGNPEVFKVKKGKNHFKVKVEKAK